MATRLIVKDNDETIRKKSKEVTEFNERLWSLLDDMKDTMYEKDGVGIAAVQVGILKRAFLVDVGEDSNGLVEFINPVITKRSGEQIGLEGCLSVENRGGSVVRPKSVTVEAVDRFGKKFTVKAQDYFARAICHEYDHLDGILFIDKVVDEVE